LIKLEKKIFPGRPFETRDVIDDCGKVKKRKKLKLNHIGSGEDERFQKSRDWTKTQKKSSKWGESCAAK